ncbi:protein kinase family protein [Nocardioides sp. LML1-1-1.1]|uniref:protein kinase family protein n=1 Tax=Nocardioides sp. LML1-1-1.1 TaxID=3135248 RepID=UPI003419A0EB
MATSTRSGDVLAGRYRLIDLLSESGGGRFWRAHDAVLERFVALHVIDVDDPRAPGLVEAARTSAGVLDPRILRVLDAQQEDGRCFVVNEWGTGTSLDILVTHAGPLGPRRAAWLVADVADAIARAHEAGVTHGRLNPENVLVDRYGAVRLIGMCVDAALHGLEPGDVQGDLEDLGGLLYCALTGVWPGPSGSIVPAAPRENGGFLSPRQVRAGVPKPLDLVWREFDCTSFHGRRLLGASEHPDVSSARGIADELLAFVGDPTGMPESLAQAIPQVNELRPVWLPAVADPLPHDSSQDDIPVVPPAPDPAPEDESGDEADDTGDIPSVTDLPTEAGIPVFGEERDDDVQWIRTRTTPPPPPPPFEEPPERPLFAPDGVRRPRPDLGPGPAGNGWPPGPGEDGAPPTGYWPWDTDPGHATSDPATETGEAVPGRSWLRLAMAVALAVLLLVAIAIAFNLGRGRDVLGGDRGDDEPTSSGSPTVGQSAPLRGVSATDFDPLGEDGENPDSVGNLTDGDAGTTWRTATYKDQLGPPPGLKTGVGVVLDLGSVRQVSAVDVRVGEGRTTLSVYAATTPPTEAPTGAPMATESGSGVVSLVPAGKQPVTARYLVVWLTSLPEVEGAQFRGEIAEVVVRGS